MPPEKPCFWHGCKDAEQMLHMAQGEPINMFFSKAYIRFDMACVPGHEPFLFFIWIFD